VASTSVGRSIGRRHPDIMRAASYPALAVEVRRARRGGSGRGVPAAQVRRARQRWAGRPSDETTDIHLPTIWCRPSALRTERARPFQTLVRPRIPVVSGRGGGAAWCRPLVWVVWAAGRPGPRSRPRPRYAVVWAAGRPGPRSRPGPRYAVV
jgi:hypothetical protein